MKSYSSREVIQTLKADGRYEVACVGDHHQYKHPSKPGRVTVTHPRKDFPIRTLKSIESYIQMKTASPLNFPISPAVFPVPKLSMRRSTTPARRSDFTFGVWNRTARRSPNRLP